MVTDIFSLDLDLILYYTPPMEDYGEGIRLTRRLQLPFVPFNGLSISSEQIDLCPAPEGWPIKDVVWDMDQEVFRAHTTLVSQDLPFEIIPDDIKSWVENGWSLQSTKHPRDDEEDDPPDDSPESATTEEVDEWELMEQYPSMNPRKRPKEFNLILRAMIRTMTEIYNNLPVAYAMDMTKRYFSEEQLKADDSKAARRFDDAKYNYSNMSFDKQSKWQDKVQRKYPRLDNLVRKT